MKLTKLLPIATVASVATIVTPLVTSCGVEGVTYDLTKISEFVPTIEKKGGQLAVSSATKTYLTDVKANKKIAYEDIVLVQGEGWAKGGMKKLTLNLSKVDPENSIISLSYYATGDGISQEMSFTNIKIIVQDTQSNEKPWIVKLNMSEDDLKSNKDWKIHIKGDGDGEDIDRTFTYKDMDDVESRAFIEIALIYIYWESYYLSDTDIA